MFHIKKERAAGIRIISTVNTGQFIVDIVLGKHDLRDLRKEFRLGFLHPEELGRGKSCESNVRGALAQNLLSDLIVEIFSLSLGAPVIPQNSGANHLVVSVQDHKAVHLSAAADPCDFFSIKAVKEPGNSQLHCFPPVGRFLLAPAGLGKLQRILLGDNVQYITFFICEEKFAGRSAQIDSNVVHEVPPFLIPVYSVQ